MTNELGAGHPSVGGGPRSAAEPSGTVALCGLQDGHSDEYFKWINDKTLVTQNAPYRPIPRSEHDKWFSTITKRADIRIFSIVVKRDRRNNELIGSCSLRNIDTAVQTAELQIRIGKRSAQNQGYGSAAICQLLQYGFCELALESIYLNVFCTNKRAIRVYEKCGFSREGIHPKGAHINGAFVDVLRMSISKNMPNQQT